MSRGVVPPMEPRAGPPPDDTGCTVLHVDMDAFYASVEIRRRPELRGLPVIVGGSGGRGVVLSATYEARRYGVHSAMPMARAVRLAPHAVVVPPDHGEYADVSRGVMAVFREVTPVVEPIALDEAFLDVSGAVRRMGSPAAIGAWIRREVAARHGITCSVGAATTKFVAKLASTRCKPDGLLVVPPDEVVGFLHPLPVSALWGVGERTAETLHRLGLRTVGELARAPVETLRQAVGAAAGEHLAALAWGRDPRRVTPGEPDKSIGAEETFATDVADPEQIRRELLRLSERTAARLREAGYAARTVSIKVRYADFRTITRARTLPAPSDVGQVLYATARELWDALRADRARIRLVGVRAEGLMPGDRVAEQLELGAAEIGWREAERAVDRATARFGSGAVRPASLVAPGPAQVAGAFSTRPVRDPPPGEPGRERPPGESPPARDRPPGESPPARNGPPRRG